MNESEKRAMENVPNRVNEELSKHQGVLPEDIFTVSSQRNERRKLNLHSSDQYSITFTYLAVLDGDPHRGR